MLSVFFDFDGLLADTEPMHMKAFDLAFEKLGIPAKSKPSEWVGKGTWEILEEIIRETGTDVTQDTIRKTRLEIFRIVVRHAPLMSNALDVLKRLSKDFQLALVTSSREEEIGGFLDAHQLRPYFKAVVTSDHVLRLKPYPDLYQLAKKTLGAKSGIALEDSQRGVQAAKAAGLYCIAVPNEYTKNQDLSTADSTVENLLAAEKIIRKRAENQKDPF